MSRPQTWWSRLTAVWSKPRMDRDLGEEIEFHLAMCEQDNLRAGMSASEARLAARRMFGGVEQVKEEYRETRGLPFLETFLADLRHGARSLRREPGIWVLAVIALAIGIGANATVFSAIRAILIRPIAMFDSSRTVLISGVNVKRSEDRSGLTRREYLAYTQAKSLESAIGTFTTTRVLSGAGDPVRLHVAMISPGFFQFFKTAPAAGRFPVDDESLSGKTNVLVLSHRFWMERFAGAHSVIGQTVRLNDGVYTIIGVANEGTWWPTLQAAVWTPFPADVRRPKDDERSILLVGTLRPGATIAQLQHELSGMSPALNEEDAAQAAPWTVRVRTLYEGLFNPNDRLMVAILFIVAGGVLLISCANVANLLLSRSLARVRETAIRLSMGATRGRLIRQSLTEALLLALPAGLLGVTVTFWTANILAHSFNTSLKMPAQLVDGTAFAFTMALSLGSVLLFGAAPAVAAGRFELANALKEGGLRSGSSRKRHLLRRTFVVLQMSLALGLTGTALFMARGVQRLHKMQIGYSVENLMMVGLTAPEGQGEMAARGYYREVLRKVAQIPSAQQASGIHPVPHIDSNGLPTTYLAEGQAEARPQDRAAATYFVAMGGALTTLQTQMIEGRDLREQDGADAPDVVVVNKALVDRCWPQGSALGKRIRIDAAGSKWFTVVGVVKDIRRSDFVEKTRPQFFVPWEQTSTRSMTVVARTDGSPAAATAIREAVRQIEKQKPVEVRNAAAEIYSDLRGARTLTTLFGVFACLALLLSALGLFGLVSQSARERTREMGVRMALGAAPGRVAALLLRETGTLTVLGILAGTAIAVGFGLVLGPLMLMPAAEPVSLSASAAVLAGVALLAALMPARMVARVNVSSILRTD